MTAGVQISDGRAELPLHGPVSRVWGGTYDKAMSLYLACLDDFAQYAKAKDDRCAPLLHEACHALAQTAHERVRSPGESAATQLA